MHTNRFKGIIDTTLRDGQQSPLLFDSQKYRFSLEDKKSLVNGLVQLGVRHLELFSPIVGKAEAIDFLALKQYIRTIERDHVALLAHVRCDERDIEQAVTAGFDGINVYIGIHERAQQSSHGLTLAEVLDKTKKLLQKTRSVYPDLYIRFSVEDFFRTSLEDVFRAYDIAKDYVQTFGMPDTVGTATPKTVTERLDALIQRYPNHDIECHFHNDRGYALINSVTAVLAGAAYIDTSIWGLAERSGITSLTGLLFNLFHENPEFCKQYNLLLCYPVNVLMGSLLRMHVPATEPVSLTNRTHTAGVHQKAVLNNSTMYEAHGLSHFGITRNELLLGPLSGWNLIYYYLREVKYYDVQPGQAKVIAQEFKSQTEKISRLYTPDALLSEIVSRHNIPAMMTKPKFLEQRLEHLP